MTTPPPPSGWPTGLQIGTHLDLDALAADAAERMSADDALASLRHLPAIAVPHLLGGVLGGIRGAAAVNRGMASLVVKRVRADQHPARSDLLFYLSGPLVATLTYHADPAAWAALLGDDDLAALRVYAADGGVLADDLSLAADLRPALVTAGLVSAIARSAPAAAVALAFLAAENASAQAAHRRLREQFPDLPGIVGRPLRSLTLKARLTAAGLPNLDALDPRAVTAAAASAAGPPDGAADLGGHATVPAPAGGLPVPGDAAARTDDPSAQDQFAEVLARWDQTTARASQVADALRAGRIPATALVDDVAADVHAALAAWAWLCDETGDDLDATRQAMTTAASEIVARRGAAAGDVGWLLGLAALEGPAPLAEQVGRVRAQAEAAVTAPGAPAQALEALWRFLALTGAKRSGGAVSYTELTNARAAVTASWPQPWGDVTALLEAAAYGEVTVPAEAPDTRAAPTPAPPPGAAEDVDGFGPDASPPPGPEIPAPAGLPATSGPEPDLDDPDLSELDELLDAGAGAALTAASTAERAGPATAPVPMGHSTAPPTVVGPTPESPGDAAPDDAAIADTLLADGRYGLAADLLEASGAPRASVAARRLAAYAVALRTPAGRLASAFADLEREVSRETLADDGTGQLVALMAAARIAVLAPSAGPAGVISRLLPRVAEQSHLTEALGALVDASHAGIVVVAETADAVGTLTQAETAAAETAAEAERVLGTSRVSIKYVPANGVYQAWLAPKEELGQLLRMVAANDPANIAQVRDKVVALGGKADKQIDTKFAEQRHNHSNKIVAGARATLKTRWDEAVGLAGSWADLAERVAERRAALAPGTWQAGSLRPLRAMRDRLAEVREAARGEIAQVSDRPAVVAAVTALFDSALEVCDGNAPAGDEPPVAYAAHHELLASALPLAAASLQPDGGLGAACLPDLRALAERDPIGPREAYGLRAARGDHDLTAVLTRGIAPALPALAEELERARVADIPRQSAAVATEVDALVDQIATRRLEGTLDDASWAALAARAEALRDASRQDFGRIRDAARSIVADLDAHRDRAIAATVARINERAQDAPHVAASAPVLTDLAGRGHVASAEEYLETVTRGDPLPSASARVNHLGRFFPAVPDALAAQPGLFDDLRAFFASGQENSGTRRLAGLGLDPAPLSAARRDAGRRALESWRWLTESTNDRNQRRIDLTTMLRAILAQAGLEFADARLEQAGGGQRGRQWVNLKSVTGTGRALTPALGSEMSRDGTLRILLVRQAPTPATMIEWMAGEPADRTVLAVWLPGALTAADRRAVADAARGRPKPPVLLLDPALLVYLACQNEPRRTTFAATALPFTAASPYRDTPGETAPEMFYGRTEELQAVLDLRGSSFVSGGRQLGKSALLRTAARRFKELDRRHEAVLTSVFTIGADGRPELIWGALWPRLANLKIVTGPAPLTDVAEAVHGAILRWLQADAGRALLILLDEADAFLEADADRNFVHVDWCRQIMEDSGHRAKVVFAGLHRTARFESLPNQPLSHLGRPVSIGPLRPQHAHELLTEPLAALGFTFADEAALPARILAMANNLPALLQLFGESLVAHLTAKAVEGPPQTVTADDVDAVFANVELRSAFRDKYVLTLNLDHRYLVITYTVAETAHDRGIDASVSLSALAETARRHWPAGFANVGADDFRSLVAECVDLGILAEDGGSYRLRTPNVLRLLGTEDEVLETLYSAPERLTVPSVSDAGSYRLRVGESREPSPFTVRQLGRMLDAQRSVVAVVGSAALGIDRAAAALDDAVRRGHGSAARAVQRCERATPAALRAQVGRVARDGTVLVVDARTASPTQLAALLETAQAAVAAAAKASTAVVVASPGNAAAWIRHPNRVDLARIDEPGLRLWCDEDNLPFTDETSRAALLAATGGWPPAVAHVAEQASLAGAATGAARLLAELEEWLKGRGGRELVHAAALTVATPVLTETFRHAAELCGPGGEDPAVLAEVLEGTDDDLVGLARAAEFSSMLDLVHTLTALGCLVVDDAGLLRPEPVLAGLATTFDGRR